MFLTLSDKVIAFFALICLSPLFALLALCVFFDLGRPIFFRQQRVGLNRKAFFIHKFRSMITSDSQVVEQAHQEGARITRFGAFLRRSNFDELPQLINILGGDMSIVGPRPHEISQDKGFNEKVAGYSKRYAVKPGLTGMAQVSGFAGPITSPGFLKKRVEYDNYWVENRTLYLYLKIIFLTVGQVFTIFNHNGLKKQKNLD